MDHSGFLKACKARPTKGHWVARVRFGVAGYRMRIVNRSESAGLAFDIGKRLDTSAQKSIGRIPESPWRHCNPVRMT